MKVAVFGNRNYRTGQAKRIFDILTTFEEEIYVQRNFYTHLTTEMNLKYDVAGIVDNEDFEADMAISIGGDGTFLRTASIVGKKEIPILGINAGRLGFLSDIPEDGMDEALSDVLMGKYRIEERTQLQLSTEDKTFEGFNYALNEVAILKQDTASMITMHVIINGEFLASYEADGLIVATPTGSTAYSLSAGGPIITPTAANFILTAVAPHSLSFRPLVVEDNSIITLDIESRNRSFLVSLDGRSNVFDSGTRLAIKKADFPLKIVKRVGHTFFGTLRDKLMWGADPRQG